MTYRELMEEVIHLGFDSAVEDLGALCSATNRAVAQLRRELCPATGRFLLTVREPVLFSSEDRPVANGGACIVSEGGASISFESVGTGVLRFVKDGEVKREETIASPIWRARKFLYSDLPGARVELVGGSDLCVRNVAVFDVADDVRQAEAIPMVVARAVTFDLTAFCDDFLALEDAPYSEMGYALRGFELYGLQLTLPRASGRIEVVYRRELKRATIADFDEGNAGKPDVPDEYADLLPLCVASYVWADVEPEKAMHYKQMYNEQLQYAKLQQKHRGKCRVIDRKGWR